jgi:cell division protein FtsB
MVFLLIIAIIFILAPIANGYAKRMSQPGLPAADAAELGRLREEMDRLTAQIAKMEDEHSFMLRLLENGTPDSQLPPPRGSQAADQAP